MAYNTVTIIYDEAGHPVPQYYNPSTNQYEPLEGSGGSQRVQVTDVNGVPILNITSSGSLHTHDDATGQPGVTTPSSAIQSSNYPVSIVSSFTSGAALSANESLISNFTAPANGTVVLSLTLDAGAPSSSLQVSRNASATTPFWAYLNNGTALFAENEFDVNIPVTSGDVVNFRVTSATTLGWSEFFFISEQ